jgi:hypothetical protein
MKQGQAYYYCDGWVEHTMGLVTGILIGCVSVVIGYFLWRWVRTTSLFATSPGKSTIPLRGHGSPLDKSTLLKLEQGQYPEDQWKLPLGANRNTQMLYDRQPQSAMGFHEYAAYARNQGWVYV